MAHGDEHGQQNDVWDGTVGQTIQRLIAICGCENSIRRMTVFSTEGLLNSFPAAQDDFDTLSFQLFDGSL